MNIDEVKNRFLNRFMYTYVTLSSFPEQLEFFYDQKLYLNHPYLKHPHLFRSGHTLTKATPNPDYLKLSEKKFQMSNLFLTLKRSGNCVEGFIFATKINESRDEMHFLNHLDLLNQFSNHFKREAKPLIDRMQKDGYNLQKSMGNAFFEKNDAIPLSSTTPKFHNS